MLAPSFLRNGLALSWRLLPSSRVKRRMNRDLPVFGQVMMLMYVSTYVGGEPLRVSNLAVLGLDQCLFVHPTVEILHLHFAFETVSSDAE